MPLFNPPQVSGWMQYTNASNNTTTALAPAFTALVIDTDMNSVANGLFTKSSTTEIRTDFDGYVQVSFKVEFQSANNDRPCRAVVVKNGAQVATTSARDITVSNANRYASASGTFILPCAVNDTFSLGFGNAEAVTTVTVFANEATFLVRAVARA